MDITIDFPGGMRVDAHAGHHTIRTDQREDDTAPSPFTHFLASIGTCAGVYVLGFCRRRGIDARGIRLSEHVTADESGHVRRVDVDVHLPPDFPEKYRDAVVRAADQCTVRAHLLDPPDVIVTATMAATEMATT